MAITQETVKKQVVGYYMRVGTLYVIPVERIHNADYQTVELSVEKYMIHDYQNVKEVEKFLRDNFVDVKVVQVSESRIYHETDV